MIKEIKYNGFTETPSDYECPDGDLATVTGLVPEDEALHPVLPPVNLFTLPAGYTVCFVHANASGYKHYIIRRDYETTEGTAPNVVTTEHHRFYWRTEDDDDLYDIIDFEDVEVYQVNAIGNTLLFQASDGMYYSLWKGGNDGYKNLGNHIPELTLSFGLQGEMKRKSYKFDFYDWPGAHKYDPFMDYPNNNGEANEQVVTEKTLAIINKFIADEVTGKGKFIFPFMVRYAYRMYDTTLTMHSAPVLMIASSGLTPQCLITEWHGSEDDWNAVEGYVAGVVHQLDYAIPSAFGQQITDLQQDWKDIITSVDIFITSPIYTYDQSGKVKGFIEQGDTSNDPYYKIYSVCRDTHDPGPYQKQLFYQLYNDTFPNQNQTITDYDRIDVPEKDPKTVADDIITASRFYLLKSIDVNKLPTAGTRTVIDLSTDYLKSLTSRELMSDDSGSHDQLIPVTSFTFNQRLNLANIYKRLFAGWNADAIFNHTSAASENLRQMYVYFYINQNNKEIVVRGEPGTYGTDDDSPYLYLFYPNPNAYKAVIQIQDTNQSHVTYYEVALEKHETLNGAYYFDGWETLMQQSNMKPSQTAPTVTTDNIVDLPNKLYTSEVDNPFVFLPNGMQTIGVSKIVGIRPAVKAMSPSQYGQFKFYVFTLDGVWALEVSSEGYLQQPSLVTPDIVLGGTGNTAPQSITQIDGAVLFASERGIMMLNGSQCTCISDILNSTDPFVPFGASAANDILPGLRNAVDSGFRTTTNLVHFRTFIQDCAMLYDYTHQRIILYSPTHDYAYTFSLKSKLWGMMPSKIQSTVLDYPNATAMIKGTSDVPVLADYSQEPADTVPATKFDSLIITRPLKLDMPNDLKTVESIIQRGDFQRGHVKTVLYGSRDLQNWHLVWSSNDHYLRGFSGTPYKYFRLALICNFTKNETLFGCSVQFTPRYQNQLR